MHAESLHAVFSRECEGTGFQDRAREEGKRTFIVARFSFAFLAFSPQPELDSTPTQSRFPNCICARATLPFQGTKRGVDHNIFMPNTFLRLQV